ncbi:MAG: zinc ribbon domain-containing protein [Bacteroidales bacterium]|nr:zinc ribbon domain-containing protein [Bacteroides sp.]MCM1198785.1 zinc ribbon domain-containing protein [Clostridium sp.]MCM1503086.1 zinc ribbon domain-containing protein [Bacteroidales bacterium]
MGTFNTKQTLYGSSALVPKIAERIRNEFGSDGYEVVMDALSSGAYDISITKGGTFKAVLGMKTALKITLLPQGGNIQFEAGVGIFGQQAIPTVISMFFFWPVLITQIWGMVEQSKLDDKALDIAKSVIAENPAVADGNGIESIERRFCTACGAKVAASAKFCSECGNQL